MPGSFFWKVAGYKQKFRFEGKGKRGFIKIPGKEMVKGNNGR
jgi:hypothetical protein